MLLDVLLDQEREEAPHDIKIKVPFKVIRAIDMIIKDEEWRDIFPEEISETLLEWLYSRHKGKTIADIAWRNN